MTPDSEPMVQLLLNLKYMESVWCQKSFLRKSMYYLDLKNNTFYK